MKSLEKDLLLAYPEASLYGPRHFWMATNEGLVSEKDLPVITLQRLTVI